MSDSISAEKAAEPAMRERHCVACDYVFEYPEPPDEHSHPKLCPSCEDAGVIEP